MKRHYPRFLSVMVLSAALLWGGAASMAQAAMPPSADKVDGKVVIRNEYYKYVFDTTQSLKLIELNNRFTQDNNVKDPANLHLGVIDMAGERHWLDKMPISDIQIDQEKGQVIFALADPSLQCQLTIGFGTTPETRWTLQMKNVSGLADNAKVVFPLLSGLVPGADLESVEFHHGLNGSIFGKEPRHVRAASGYSFPVMDVFNKKLGGVYLISEDPDQNLQGYELVKKRSGETPGEYSETYWLDVKSDNVFDFDMGCGFAVVQGVESISADGIYQTPPVVIGVHPGRWEKAWESYRDWLRTIATPRSDDQVQWWREVYLSKAIHEGNYWKDGKFDWTQTIQPFDQNTYFDINHWMDNRGDYHVRENQGGAEAWKKELVKLRRQGVPSAFYFEACCLDPLSEVGKAHPDWAVLKANGQRYQEKGEANRPETREYNMCPGSPWRDFIAQTAARVLGEVNLDAVYLDSMALRCHRCQDTNHDHPAGKGWHRDVGLTLGRVVEEIDKVKPNTPLYCEFYSSGINALYMHGCYGPGAAVAEGITAKGLDLCKTGTCLYRFYFPKFKMIDIVNIDKYGVGLAFFNGNGVHEFFTNTDQWPWLSEFCRVWHQNVGAFTSDRPEPLVETGSDDVFMNKFPDGSKTVYTLWNGSNAPMVQKTLAFQTQNEYHYVELFQHRELKSDGEKLSVDIPLKEVAVFAQLPRVLTVQRGDGGAMVASYKGDYKNPSLVVYAKLGDRWAAKPVEFETSEIPVNNNTIYDPNRVGGLTADKTVSFSKEQLFGSEPGEEIAVVLLDGETLVDEVPSGIIY